MSATMSDAEVLAAIRANHLKANISWYEAGHEDVAIRWDQAFLDPGGTIFGPGPYAHVPITLTENRDQIVVRVYPPERLRKRLAAKWKPAERAPTEDPR